MSPASRFLASVVLVAAFAAASARAGEFKSRFSFNVPAGWADKSSPETRDVALIAFDDADQLVFQAMVRPGAEKVTPEFLDAYCTRVAMSVAQHIKSGQLKVVKKSTFQLHGVTGARFLFEMPPPPDAADGAVVRQLQFYLPLADQSAILTFSAPQASYDKFEALFDKTARSTVIRK